MTLFIKINEPSPVVPAFIDPTILMAPEQNRTEEFRKAKPKEPSSPSFWNLFPKASILSSILKPKPIKPPIIRANRTPSVLLALPAMDKPRTNVTRPEEVMTIVLKEEGSRFFNISPRIVPKTTDSEFIKVTSMLKS